jgi:hypothetical protein
MLKKSIPIMEDIIDHIQQGVSQEDIDTVIRTMKKIIENINSEELVAMLTK